VLSLGGLGRIGAGHGGGRRRKALNLLQVRGAECRHAPLAGAGQLQPDDPAIAVAASPADQPERFHPVGQLDGAVVADQQIGGDLADGRAAWVGTAADHQQQLVLGGGEPAAVACSWLQRRNLRSLTRKASSCSYCWSFKAANAAPDRDASWSDIIVTR
jgi:hypothetical protein